jgi:alkylmercury lyase
MQHPPLETIAKRLSVLLYCEQEELCRPIIQQVARGRPVTKADLQVSLRLGQDELERRLAHLPDTEFDQQGNILGWGVTLLPTSHQFQLDGQALYTWCAFDTVLFPPSLQRSAKVQSSCAQTGHPIAFVATPEGVVKDLTPGGSVMSLILPAERSECVRETFCYQSLFFQSEQAASTFLAGHPEAILLSVEEAALVGIWVAQSRFTEKPEEESV